MVARKPPDWLPAGWTEQFTVLKTGRQIRYYTNSGIDQKFFSKEDVIRYTKLRSSLNDDAQPTNRHTKRRSNNKHMQVVETNEHPEWLPDGWIMKKKTRKSGSATGKPYKIYVDPLTGCRYYSKPEVFRYLKSVKRKKCAFKQKKTVINMQSASKPSAAKWQKLKHPATRRQLFAGEGNSDMKSLDLSEIGALRKRHGMTESVETRLDPSNEILPGKQSMENVIEKGIETKGNPRLSSSTLPKAEGSKRDLGKRGSADRRPVSTPAVDSLQQKNPLESELEKSSNTKTRNFSSKSKIKKELTLPCRSSKRLADIHQEKNSFESELEKSSNRKTQNYSCKSNKTEFTLPCRSSKRLAGLEPELVPNSVSNKRSRQGTTTKSTQSCKREAILAAGMNLDSMADEASQQLKTGSVTELAHHAFADTNIPSCEDLSNTSNKPLKDSAVPIEQPQKLETKKINDESEPQLVFPFGYSCLDPCLEFAFKTLTGEIPVGDISEYRPVSTPAADILQEKSFLEGRTEKSSNRKTQINLRESINKKDLHLPCRSSKRLAGQEPEIGADIMFSERAHHIETGKSNKSEVIPDVETAPDGSTIGASQLIKAGPEAGLAQHVSTDLHEDPSIKSKNPFDNQTLSKEHTQKLEAERMNGEEPDSSLFSPFGDYWSDPCLEFAFKTLTGAIPVEDNLVIQGYFQQQLNPSHAQREANLALPDFGMPSFFQSDISSHFDSTEKQATSRQQLPMNPPFLPHGNVNLPSCSSISSQQPCLEGNKEIPGKVNS